MDLLLHPDTKLQLETYFQHPVHGLLLEGEAGMGKGAIATWLVMQILGLTQDRLATHSYFLKITPQKNTISIDTIRQLQDFIKLKTIGSETIRRAVIIEDSQAMTIEAQNAILKLLEEPPADTIIIMTAAHNQTLLPTIYSRVQRIHVKAVSKDVLTEYFQKQGNSAAETERAYYVSGGQTGLMYGLLTSEEEHPLAAGITEAKQLLAMNQYERMTRIDGLSKNKEQLPELLQAMQRVYRAVLKQASDRNQTVQIKQAHKALQRLITTQAALKHNPNTKLLLTDLLLNI